ncbi:unnamed protein product [Knipowitschia caucasica]
MSSQGLELNQDTFSCPICLDLLKTPVTIPCGHSYCMSCVDTHWDGEEGKKSFSCPQCRQSFCQRPVLVKNTMLAVLMEGLMKIEVPVAAVAPAPSAVVAPCSPAQGDAVCCDLCSGAKVKAVKSCLQCQVSYCEEHLQPHYHVAALKKHKLVEPIENLQDCMCPRHNEVMKMFCRTDQQCICYLCSLEEHKGHDTVTAAAERTEKHRELEACRENLLLSIKSRESTLLGLKDEIIQIGNIADTSVKHCDNGVQDLINLIWLRMKDVKTEIQSLQQAENHRLRQVQNTLQQQITEMKTKCSELDSLSHTEDHLQFLQKFKSISKVSVSSESTYTRRLPPPFMCVATSALKELKDKIEGAILLKPNMIQKLAIYKQKKNHQEEAVVKAPSQQEIQKPASKVFKTLDRYSDTPPYKAIPQSDPKEWPELPNRGKIPNQTASIAPHLYRTLSQPVKPSFDQLRQLARLLTWDPRTVNAQLSLSKKNSRVKRLPYRQDYSDNTARFTEVPQVLSKECLSERCYWNIGVEFENVVTVAVAYKDMRRSGSCNDYIFGKNNKSWALECYKSRAFFWHDGNRVNIPLGLNGSCCICVFLDYEAGILSFYEGYYNNRLMHTVKTTFTGPLVAGVRLHDVTDLAELFYGL